MRQENTLSNGKQFKLETESEYRQGDTSRAATTMCAIAAELSEDDIDAALLGQVAVLLQITRVFLEILTLAELGRVDEDRENQDVAPRAALLEQREMSPVQEAHGRYERNGPARLPLIQAAGLHVSN